LKVENRILRGVSLVALGISVSTFIGVLFHPILARLLGPEGYGDFGVLMALFMVSSYVFLFGMNKSARKHLAEYDGLKQGIMSFCVLAVVFSGLLAFLLGLMIFSSCVFLGNCITENLIYLLALSSPAIIASNLHNITISFLYSQFEEDKAESINIVRKLIFFLGSIILVYHGFGIEAVAALLFLAPMVSAALGLHYVSRSIGFSLDAAKNIHEKIFREIIEFAALIFLINLFIYLHLYFDLILIALFQGSEQAGVYKAMSVIAHFLWFIPLAVNKVSLYNFSEMVSNSRQDEIENYVGYVVNKQQPFIALLGLGVIVLAEPFVQVYYGESFLQGAIILQILVIGSVLGSSAMVVSSALEATGKIIYSMKAALTAAAINIVLGLILIPSHGMFGAAVATAISYTSMMFTYFYYYFKATGFNLLKQIGWGKVLFSTVLTSLVLFPAKTLLDNHLMELIAIPIIGASIYFVLSVRLGIYKVSEFKNLLNQLLGVKTKFLDKLFDLIKRIEP